MAHIIDDAYGLFIVADGLGGHSAGEKASRFFCQGMLRFAETYSKRIVASNPPAMFSVWIWIADAVKEMKKTIRSR